MKNKETIKQIRNQIEVLKKEKLKLEIEDRISFWVEKLGYIPEVNKTLNMNGKEYYIECVEERYHTLTVRQHNEKREYDTRTYIDSSDFKKDSGRVITKSQYYSA
jgi:hypothetical protein